LLHYHNLHNVGLYSIGAIFSQPVLLINMAVQMSFGVLFFQSYYNEKDEAKTATRKMAIDIYQLYLVGSVVLATGLSVFANILVPFVATPDYADGARVVPLLVFSYIAAQSYQTMGPGISLSEKTWHFAWITGLTALLNIGLNFLLVPRWGYMGAGLATLISFIVYWQIKVKVAARYFPVAYPFFRINAFFLLAVSVSLAIVLGVQNQGVIMRIGALVLVTASAFLFKLLKWEEVCTFTKGLRRRARRLEGN
jgi:O-antigen/teichoic acid export membrane protein